MNPIHDSMTRWDSTTPFSLLLWKGGRKSDLGRNRLLMPNSEGGIADVGVYFTVLTMYYFALPSAKSIYIRIDCYQDKTESVQFQSVSVA